MLSPSKYLQQRSTSVLEMSVLRNYFVRRSLFQQTLTEAQVRKESIISLELARARSQVRMESIISLELAPK